jgi:hypothetical protein
MSNPFITLYIDGTKSPKSSLVQSGSSNPIQLQDVVAGDQMALGFTFVDASNGVDGRISGSEFSIKAAIGSYTSGIYASSSLWTYSSSIWTGSIDLNNSFMSSALSGKTSISAVFEVQVSDSNYQTTRSYCQAPITVYQQIIP